MRILSLFLLISVSLGYSQDRPQLTIEPIEGPVPWTSLNLNNDPSRFQFAVVTDRTGGHRPGIFMDGVNKLNLLQPEFVMSVGDLIEGYTTDKSELSRQWDEFEGFVNQLEMPFFYVPGNHDITNWTMDSVWRERFGPANYHFIYKDVLFLALNSEDQARGAGRGTISDQQYEWVKGVLEKNKDVKWTLLFMHQPLWHQEDTKRWADLEKLLADRKHTVFTGHEHRYVKAERNNGKYFVLATTGGGSSLRGARLGEFDHVVWITMTGEGPVIANLQLEGIWNEDVVDQDTKDYITRAFRKNPVSISPLFLDNDSFESGSVEVRLTNDEDVPMKISFEESFSWDLVGYLDEKECIIPPNSVETMKLTLLPRKESWQKPYSITARVSYEETGKADLTIPFSYKIKPLPRHQITEAKRVKIDGDSRDWKSYSNQLELSNGQKAEFEVSYDEDNLYIAAFVPDDNLLVDPDASPWNQDHLGIGFNAFPMKESAMSTGSRSQETALFLLFSPEVNGELPRTYGNMLDVATLRSVPVESGFFSELSVPLDYIRERQGDDWSSLRINITVGDNDGEGMQNYWWYPDWGSGKNIIGSGMFFRK